MELKILHFYPDLMSLYGSYANVSILKRTLEEMGNTVTVERVELGGDADLTHADFVYMGAGTERAQKAALLYFSKLGDAVKAAADAGVTMLFAGNSMELLGKTITDDAGKVYEGLGLADFTAVQNKKRFVEDVYGHTDLYEDAVVGFINRCSVITGVKTPLVTSMDPALLKIMVQAIYRHRGETCPEIPVDQYMAEGWAITAEQLKARCTK
mgnify:CR=1 FL=1